jgi:hypothetical protein|nr:MAG TPA: Terminase large subunit [Caudoviricetes sp.]
MEKEKVAKTEAQTILKENEHRQAVIHAVFNPVTGQGSVGRRVRAVISDFPIKEQWLPKDMMRVPLVRQIVKCGSIGKFLAEEMNIDDPTEEDVHKVVEQFVRIRCKHDFPFWAAMFVYIKNKGGGPDVLFRLTRPQRKLVEVLEGMRTHNMPIRLILLKARQWGGSTTIQLYMAWLQLVLRVGLNSLIIAHQGMGSDEIMDMFNRMMASYPVEMLHKLGEKYNDNEETFVGVGKSGAIKRVPQRNCKIKIGTAERPDSCRGGDYNLVHLSEVGLWKTTDGKKPEDIVRSACSGMVYRPYTMVVYESTANGTGNFFQREYDAAKAGRSMFKALFIAWYDIDIYTLPFASDDERADFAISLWENRNNHNVMSDREECGAYLWKLWTYGATLEAIHWYVVERSGKNSHSVMASEYPSDDIEAFVNSGSHVFDEALVDKLKAGCRPPKFIGDVYGDKDEGPDALRHVRFSEDKQGLFWIWEKPDIDPEEVIRHRYLVTVDIGGRSNKADWSVIVVFDRLYMMDGDKPVVVAQWYGHIDIDLLAWKAAQIAAYYDNALLVIESNTLETHDKERIVDGDQSQFILNQIKDVYDNLYARKQSEEDIKEGAPRKYGFHTNVSTKPMIISTLVKVIRESLYVERDERCLDEYKTYERKQNGAFGAIEGKHDDLLMTRAIGLHICFFEMETPKAVKRHASIVGVQRTAVSAATI